LDKDDVIELMKEFNLGNINSYNVHFVNQPPLEAKRYLCDMLEVGYHTPKDQLLKMLSDRI
jgi:hypothetical protein